MSIKRDDWTIEFSTCEEYVNEDRHVPVHIIPAPAWYTLGVKLLVPEGASTVL
jgi:hypothetical protein